jgi:lysophospholipase L1-like esterase
MTEKISVRDLEKMLLDPMVPEEDLRPYVELDELESRAFAPQVRIRREAVVEGPEEAAVILGSLNGVSRWRRQRRYRRRIAEDPNLLRIVSEGDSWFQYPILLDDVIDQLFDRYAIFSLGAAGDLLEDMLRQREMVQSIGQERARLLLISGGGNDLLGRGRLKTYLRSFDPGRPAEEYLNEHFPPFLAELIGFYRDLFVRVTEPFPELKALCHGYGHAVPASGRWLGDPMEELGIEDRALQREIVGEIVDRFNAALANLADEFDGKVTYIDCREIIPSGEWHDELHPTDAGFAAVAERFAETIDSLVA